MKPAICWIRCSSQPLICQNAVTGLFPVHSGYLRQGTHNCPDNPLIPALGTVLFTFIFQAYEILEFLQYGLYHKLKELGFVLHFSKIVEGDRAAAMFGWPPASPISPNASESALPICSLMSRLRPEITIALSVMP